MTRAPPQRSMSTEEENTSPKNSRIQSKRPSSSPRSDIKDGIFSPRFRSAATMAGWDAESLLLASLVVEDTPVRESRHKKRKPPSTTHSPRKRRSKRQDSMPAVVLCLDDEEEVIKKDLGVKKKEVEDVVVNEVDRMMKGEGGSDQSDHSSKGMDRLREELSCAICLEICFEPSTTPCGHSFCKKCLKCAASKCGKKCPKCRQLISNGRSCTVNTVHWNTIQLLFPDKIKARMKATSTNTRSNEEVESKIPESSSSQEVRISRTRVLPRGSAFISATRFSLDMERNRSSNNRRRATPTQSEDAALALRLQREEFMGAFIDTSEQTRPTTVHSARANLRVWPLELIIFALGALLIVIFDHLFAL